MNTPDHNKPSSSNDMVEGRPHIPALPEGWASYSPADEIDLVDLGVLLWRHRRIMGIVFAVFAALTVLAVIIKHQHYDYTTAIELGSTVSASGVTPLMSGSDAQNALKQTYLPDAMYQYGAQHPDALPMLQSLKITVKGDDKSTLVTLTCRVRESQAKLCTEIEKMAAGTFVRNNSRQSAAIKADLQAKVSSATLDLQALRSPVVFNTAKLAAQKAIADAKNNLHDLQSAATLLKLNEDKLNVSKSLYEQQIKQLQAHVAEVNKAGIDAAKQTSDATQAMANLLLSTESQKSIERLNDIQQKLAVDIPEQLASIKEKIVGNTRDQVLAKQTIAQNEAALQKLLFSHGQDIDKQQAAIVNLKAQLDNVQETRVISQGIRSLVPQGLGRKAILALGILVSIFLALCAAFIAHFLGQVRERLAQSER